MKFMMAGAVGIIERKENEKRKEKEKTRECGIYKAI